MAKITAIIPTLNEEANVTNALRSVAFADEVIVIDSYSTDKTVEIARSHGAIIFQREFDDFSSQKIFAIQQAKYDWIFLLDADETLNEELQKEIRERADDPDDFVGFFIYRKFFFKNRRLKFSGWQHDKVVRLFNRQFCQYKGKVHEKIVSTGKIGFLKHKILHYSYKDINRYKKKLDFYAFLQAKELYEKNKRVNLYHFLIKPIARFVIQYFIKLGFVDGIYGFIICRVHAHGVYLRYKKLLELRHLEKKRRPPFTFNAQVDPSNIIDISIVIVNYRSWKYLDSCLSSLQQFNRSLFTYEILVVDNCSNDDKLTTYKTKFKDVIFIENTGNNGFANGCNTGARASRGKHLLFLNPDTIANEEALYALLKYAKENKHVGVVSCLQKNENDFYENIVRFFPSLITLFGLTRALYKVVNYKNLSKRYNSIEELAFPDWVSGSVVFMYRDWFQKINGWNEDYWMYYEDVDLCKEVKNQKGDIVLLESVEVLHFHGGASRINVKTVSITKTEVLISKHVYINNHFIGWSNFLGQFLVVFNNLIFRTLLAALGLIFFFIPKLHLNLYIYIKLMKYYGNSLVRGTWLSKRSLNY